MSAYTPITVTANSAGLTTATTAYAAGDQAGTEITISAIGAASGYVIINDIVMIDYSARIGSHEIRLFNAATTPAADNAAASWSDTDEFKLRGGIIYCSSITADSLNATCNYSFKPFLMLTDGSGNIYLDVVLRAIPTSNFFSAVSDLHFVVSGYRVS
jgi:hypothetical protein